MNYAFNEESNKTIRPSNELLQQYDLTENIEEQPKVTYKRFSNAGTNFHNET